MNLDQLIDDAHTQVERTEQEARQIEARIIKAGGVPPRRPYGRPVSGEDVARNLTLRGLLQARDPALAAFLGFGSDLARKREEDAAAAALQAEALRMKTEQLRQRNEAAAAQRYRRQLAGINPNTGRRW